MGEISTLVRAKAKLDSAAVKEKYAALEKELQLWEAYLDNGKPGLTGGQAFIAGEVFTMADAIFFPHIAYMVRLGASFAPRYPHLQTYYNHVVGRKSIQATWPPHWKTDKASSPGFFSGL